MLKLFIRINMAHTDLPAFMELFNDDVSNLAVVNLAMDIYFWLWQRPGSGFFANRKHEHSLNCKP